MSLNLTEEVAEDSSSFSSVETATKQNALLDFSSKENTGWWVKIAHVQTERPAIQRTDFHLTQATFKPGLFS
ncbi:hypothetical protein AAFF_G00354970 [Aldrovandia affinis]|uniref:Uncharacterized protein n=1 Tax=Aldrovandia affinis TaxID=143900 RepID=A0AAD7SII7_9TELE|nr:hypothetical protein AAFF_G00354970 [Aldrovandia affinis]